MFEKYNMIHVDISSSTTERNDQHLFKNIRINKSNNPQYDTYETYSIPAMFENTPDTNYQITGSFDFLVPFIGKETATAAELGELFLQSFCVMDNTKGYYTRRKHYDSFLLTYTYSGAGHLNYMGKPYTVDTGKGFLIDCRLPHEYASGQDGWEHVDIHFWGKQAEAIYQYFLQNGIVTFTYSAPAINRMVEHLLKSYRIHSELRTLYIGNSLSDLLCAILKQAEQEWQSGIPDTYKYILQYMENNYMHALSLDDLSALFHISKFHLSREFKKYTGYSPNEYLIMLRVQHACILLSTSTLSVEETAFQSGFENMSNFVYQIKKRTGMTPSAFRKMNR